ncbi:MAG: 3-deoxy-8-phosphooctulonate synthase, partial [PS1 clade bacterium]
SALCDAPSCLPLSGARDLLSQLKVLHDTVS